MNNESFLVPSSTHNQKMNFLEQIHAEIKSKHPHTFGGEPVEKSVEDFDSTARSKYQTVYGMGTI